MYSKCAAGVAVAVIAAALFFVAPVTGTAQQAKGGGGGLEGSWSGGGEIKYSSGETEQARCRASFRRSGGNTFGMSAVCATASARVQQTADLTKISDNRYHGEFVNQEFGIQGSIRIVVNGDSLDASLSGGGGSAEMSLSR